ncbi:DEDDh family exonuclease [Streptomyces sp. NPDC092129]|uniref:DEDDh family exonuclease n=1 Tax=Streptomyces sp. NPDC092129 TaxID=3366010 RepID=UPI00380C2657
MSVVSARADGPSSLPSNPAWAVVDVETSGLRPYQHRVLSVAVLTLDASGRLTEEFSTLFDPGCDPGPVHIHGLTAQRLRGAPTFEQVADRIGLLLTDRILVAHNAQFDYEFLAHEFARARSWLPVSQRLCTLALNRRIAPPTDDLKLASLASFYGVRQQQAHDALDDARVLAGVLRGSLAAADELGLELPVVACPPKQGIGYPPRVPKTSCAFRNPGLLMPGTPLVQGMKIAFTGGTRTSREELTARAVAAGLNVVGSVSRHTSVLIANDRAGDTAKARAAQSTGVPVITEAAFLALLADVQPGTTHKAFATETGLPAPRSSPRPGASAAVGALSGHRVLVLGGPHDQAAATRSRIVDLGGAAAVNLSAGVTDVILLPGGEHDRRMSRITDRRLPVHDADWLNTAEPASTPGPADTPVVLPRLARDCILPRGGVIDLPAQCRGPQSWRVSAAWAQQANKEVDVVAFIVDEDEQVSCDEDFVFYGAPENPGSAVQLVTEGPTEQGIVINLSALPDTAHKVVVAAALDGSGTFADVGAIEITVSSSFGEQAVAQATLDAATTERSLILAEVYRRGPFWRIRAVGQGHDHDLAATARAFGVDITD